MLICVQKQNAQLIATHKSDLPLLQSNVHRIARLYLSIKDLPGKCILDLALHRAAQRSCSVFIIKARLGNMLFHSSARTFRPGPLCELVYL